MSALFVALTTLIAAQGSAYTETFNRANDAYKAGDYAGAIQGFEQLVSEQVVDETVFYNLGNAYYRSGKLAPAITNYERALLLDPGLDNARQNLTHCVNETKQRLARPLPPDWEQSLLFWHYRLRPTTTYWLAVSAWLTLWVALGVRRYRAFPYLRSVAALAGILAIAFGASAWAKSSAGALAVISADTAPVRFGTDEKQTVRFELHEGDRVAIDRRERGWSRVKTAGGETGWTQDANLLFVGPPYEPFSAKVTSDAPPPGNTK